MGEQTAPIGAVLAGGAGRRIGGSKAIVELQGRPLLSYPVGVLQAALEQVVVVAKAATELPGLPSVEIWLEPDEPRHPLTGLVHALAAAEGRAVLIAAGDLPFLTVPLVMQLATVPTIGAPALVPRAAGRLQPLLARYEPAALAPLSDALSADPGSLSEIVEAIAPRVVELDDEGPFFNVNRPEDLLTAAAMMDRPGSPGAP
ncbi:MAG TPA: molybdenum cofactor guanylyltransferase [Conexibacter sp.]|jgi:molybdopterin-guanine dinucleotide biosynthesis protein A